MNDGHDAFDGHFESGKVGVWILYGFPVKNLHTKLLDLLIEYDDERLTTSDHALLLYTFCQNEITSDSLEGIPLSMLYDIFTPIIETNLASWREA
jgi:hypothetical protein